VYANVSLEKLTLYHFIIIHTLVNSMIHEQMTFLFFVYVCFLFFWQNVLWNFGPFFFFEKCMFEWMNAWIFLEDALLNTWFFFNAYILKKKMLLWMHDFFECIYYVCLNEFFHKKIHLRNFGIFLFENAFMNAWFLFGMHI